MKQLQKTLLAQVAGGVAEATTAAAVATTSGGWDDDYDRFGDGGSGGGGPAVGNFDGNGVGPTSCVGAPAAPPAAPGLFGYSLTETLAGAGALGGLTVGVGQGVGASLALDAAGGLSGAGAMGSAAPGLLGSAALGLTSSLGAGYVIGTAAYNSSETVQDAAQAVVGRVVEVAPEIPGALGAALNGLFTGQHLGRAGVGGQ